MTNHFIWLIHFKFLVYTAREQEEQVNSNTYYYQLPRRIYQQLVSYLPVSEPGSVNSLPAALSTSYRVDVGSVFKDLSKKTPGWLYWRLFIRRPKNISQCSSLDLPIPNIATGPLANIFLPRAKYQPVHACQTSTTPRFQHSQTGKASIRICRSLPDRSMLNLQNRTMPARE